MVHSELAQKFYDPSYLPTYEDFFKVFGKGLDYQSAALNWTEYSKMLSKKNPVFELWNFEYINANLDLIQQKL